MDRSDDRDDVVPPGVISLVSLVAMISASDRDGMETLFGIDGLIRICYWGSWLVTKFMSVVVVG